MSKNKRCPLQNECEKKCEYENHELDCPYYACNGIGENTIPDQEEIRKNIEKQLDEANFSEYESHDGIEWIDIRSLTPHPNNPRKDLGDLTELAASIKAKGILQNLTVVENDEGGFTIIIGHRRFAAAKIAGLTELPCIIADMTPAEQVQTMLLENMQRSDLTVYEQAQGFQMMMDFGDTIDTVAEKTGFSKTTIRRRLKMAELNADTLKEVSTRQVSMQDFDQLAKIDDLNKRNEILESIGTNNFNIKVENALKKQNIAKNLPLIKEQIKALKANKITRTETYGGNYTLVGKQIKIDKWDGTPISVPNTTKLFYYLDEDWGDLAFYTKKQKSAPVKRSDEEIEKEKVAREAAKKLKEAASVHFKLRQDFANSITLTAKNRATLMLWIAKAILYEITDWMPHGHLGTVLEAFDIANSNDHTTNCELVNKALEADEKLIPKLLWVYLGDKEDQSYFSSYEGQLKNGILPNYIKNRRLDLIYGYLCAFGYELSDEEKEIRNGTSPYYAAKVDVETYDGEYGDDGDEDEAVEEESEDEKNDNEIVNALKEMYDDEDN